MTLVPKWRKSLEIPGNDGVTKEVTLCEFSKQVVAWVMPGTYHGKENSMKKKR